MSRFTRRLRERLLHLAPERTVSSRGRPRGEARVRRGGALRRRGARDRRANPGGARSRGAPRADRRGGARPHGLPCRAARALPPARHPVFRRRRCGQRTARAPRPRARVAAARRRRVRRAALAGQPRARRARDRRPPICASDCAASDSRACATWPRIARPGTTSGCRSSPAGGRTPPPSARTECASPAAA